MSVRLLLHVEALAHWPQEILWLEENNIEYRAYEEWIPSTGEYGVWKVIPNEIDAIAFKLRWS